jgi:hypothetical protein
MLSIIGGVYSIKRKGWLVALTGAIFTILPSFVIMRSWGSLSPYHPFSIPKLIGFVPVLPAILAIVLIVLSRKQFVKK